VSCQYHLAVAGGSCQYHLAVAGSVMSVPPRGSGWVKVNEDQVEIKQ